VLEAVGYIEKVLRDKEISVLNACAGWNHALESLWLAKGMVDTQAYTIRLKSIIG
jgi:hypothetical protein